jgi:hypothetical protein
MISIARGSISEAWEMISAAKESISRAWETIVSRGESISDAGKIDSPVGRWISTRRTPSPPPRKNRHLSHTKDVRFALLASS